MIRCILLILIASSSCLGQDWSKEVVYYVHIDRFEGDGLILDASSSPYGFRKGTLRGLTQKLSYIKSLGFTALLLNPVFAGDSPSGYAVRDFFSVDDRIGTIEDYKKLIQKAHENGLKVFFDMVMNHTSGNSPLYARNPSWFRPKFNSRDINSSLIDSEWSRITFYLNQELNVELSEVQDFFVKVISFWESMGIDGLRMDAVTLVGKKYWGNFNKKIKKLFPQLLILGEAFTDRREDLCFYSASFDALFDFRFYRTLKDVMQKELHPVYIADELKNNFCNSHLIPFRFIDNHDVPRFYSSVDTSREKLELALTLLMASPGVPVVMYGTEVPLENDPHLLGTDFDASRSTMKWGQGQESSLIKSLIELRKKYSLGDAESLFIADRFISPLVVMSKKVNDTQLLIFMNFSGNHIEGGWNISDVISSVPASHSFVDFFTHQKIEPSGNSLSLSLKPWGFLVYEAK